MRFLGLDLGWRTGPSGLAVLEWDGKALQLLDLSRRTELRAILDWVEEWTGTGPGLVAVDAPTLIPNATGMRLPDRLTHRYFGKYHAGCYPANQGRPFAERTTLLGQELRARGFQHSPTLVPQALGRYQIECFPHPAIVRFFDLPQIIKYKKGTLAQRQSELSRYRQLLLTQLPQYEPYLQPLELPEIPSTGHLLKAVEDQLDGLVCAYVGAYWWYWGLARNELLGDESEGYIVVPLPPHTD